MARFIKIKKENFASGLNMTADVVLGSDQIGAVIKGTYASPGNANACTVYFSGASYLEFTNTAKGADIALAINNALSANPGGVLAIVQLDASVEISGIASA